MEELIATIFKDIDGIKVTEYKTEFHIVYIPPCQYIHIVKCQNGYFVELMFMDINIGEKQSIGDVDDPSLEVALQKIYPNILEYAIIKKPMVNAFHGYE